MATIARSLTLTDPQTDRTDTIYNEPLRIIIIITDLLNEAQQVLQ